MVMPADANASRSSRADNPAAGPSIDRSRPYPSCDWLEGGLAFNRRSIHACLIVHHGRGFPKLCDFNGGEVPWEEVARARRELIRRNQLGGHPDCAGCPNLVTKMWPEPAHDVYLVGIAQFVRCNIFCSYCFLQTQDPSSFAEGLDPYAVAPAIDALIRDGRIAPDVTVDWGGGEPTIYREFDELLKTVTELGGTTWVHTNGSRFPKPLAEGMPAGRVGIICSVDAGFPETYRQMKGRDYLERVWSNLRRFADAGCPVHLKYIVKEENCSADELQAFVERASTLGAQQLIVDLDYNLPHPSPQVLAGMLELKELAQRSGMRTAFGATGSQVVPELDEARRAWEETAERPVGRRRLPLMVRSAGTASHRPAGPGRVAVMAGRAPFSWEVTVRSRLTGEALEACFEGPVTAVCSEGGRFQIEGPQPGDMVTVKAFAHQSQDVKVETGLREVALAPAAVAPEAVFDLLRGFAFVEVPEGAGGDAEALRVALGISEEEFEPGKAPAAARFVVHQHLTATLLVLSLQPAATVRSESLPKLARGFAAFTGCKHATATVDGELVFAGRSSDRLHWFAVARQWVIFVVLAEDEGFADGIARAIVRQIR